MYLTVSIAKNEKHDKADSNQGSSIAVINLREQKTHRGAHY